MVRDVLVLENVMLNFCDELLCYKISFCLILRETKGTKILGNRHLNNYYLFKYCFR